MAIVAVAVVLWARPEVVLGVLLTAVFVVPAPLRVPHTHSSYLTLLHVLVLAGLGRVVVRWSDGSLRGPAFRLTPVHRLWVVFVAVAFTAGVVLVSVGSVSSAGARLVDLAAQVGFFVVVLALLRELPRLFTAVLIAGGATALGVAVGLVEHLTGGSLGHWWFSGDPNAFVLDAAHPLGVRGGQARVRAGAEFALQYGWLLVTMLPIVVVAAVRTRIPRAATVIAVVAVTAAVYWSYTRSAYVAVPVALVLLAVLAREQRSAALASGAVVVTALAVVFDTNVLHHASQSVDTGSIDVRFQRIAPILEQVARHPFRGLGLGNLTASGFPTTDNAYLLQYTELGVLGVVILGMLLAAALVQGAAGIRAANDDLRLVGGACATGIICYLASAMFYDAFTLLQGALLLWFLVALGTVVAERAGVAVALPRPSRRWVTATAVVGAVAGGAVYYLAPVHVAVNTVFVTLPVAQQAGGDPVYTGTVLANTVCAAADPTFVHVRGAHLDCRPNPDASGYGALRIEAPSARAVGTAAGSFSQVVHEAFHVSGFRLLPTSTPVRGRATVFATAPVWVPLTALVLLFGVPWRRDPKDASVPRSAVTATASPVLV